MNVKKEKSKRKTKRFIVSVENFTLLMQSNSYQWKKKNNNCLLESNRRRTFYSRHDLHLSWETNF